jgi:WD40 repeat protein/DNA-binding SARP family transcriptional activator
LQPSYRELVEFGLLGPLTVRSGTADVALGGPRQRTVLAHLLLHANHELSADQLIDRVWGERPPATARGSLHAYVSRLRGALGQGRLPGRAGRYVLCATEDEVDALRFAALCADARRVLGSDAATASRLLRTGLDLWRGEPLEDLADEPSLAVAISRLRTDRLDATEDWAEAELTLGRPGGVVPVLQDVVRRDPFRERAWGQLVLALYRCGRQRDALDAYERLRHVLSEELGIDPWPGLRHLHEQVVRQDRALDEVGRPLRGYRLVDQVGEGTFGTVHRAVHADMGREVAVKVVRPELANSPDFVRRFETEAQVAARLEHPHVVPLHDYWRDPDGAYLVMRLMRGGSLRTILSTGPLPPDRVASVVDQVADALSFAHQQGVVHRDVKPANILFDESGNAYLSDFGIAWDTRVQPDGGVLRSPSAAYVAPEATADGPVDGRADTYSLAVVALEALTGRSPGSIPNGEVSDEIRQVVARATATDPDKRPSDVLDLARDLRGALDSSARVGPTVAGRARGDPSSGAVQVRNPYKGLRAFTAADADDFHGRHRLVETMLARLGDGPRSRFLAIVGPSGSGKSSVVAAGLLPALRAGGLPGSDGWFVAQMHPGDHPFDELAVALTAVSARPRPRLVRELRGEAGLTSVVTGLLPDPASQLLLVVDQFEEVFTLVDDAGERDQFLATLVEAACHPAGRVRVVVTLRADFYDQPLAYPGLAELVSSGTVTVTPLGPDELERAIAAPAQGVGVDVDPALVAALVADVSDQPASLPLLQYALTEVFDLRQGGPLGLVAYRRVGGLSGALARRAEDLYERLDPVSRDAVRQVFLHLVTLGEEGAPVTRRRVTRSTLASLGVPPDAMTAAVDAFVSRRLLTVDRDPVTRGPTVEVAHEALLREWDRLRAWVDDARGDVVVLTRLAAAAREWTEGGRDDSALLRGERLRRFETWAAGSEVALGLDERKFLTASLAQREVERRLEEDRARHQQLLERRSLIRLRVALVVVAIGAVVASALTVVAMDQRANARDQARASRARELAAASLANLGQDPELSTLLALEAVAATRGVEGGVLREAEEALHRSVQTNRVMRSWSQGGGGVAVTGSSVLVTAGTGSEGDVPRTWDLETGEQRMSLDAAGPATYVAASPDGSLLAVGGTADGVQLLDALSGERVRSIRAPGAVRHLGFSADGRRLAGLVGNTVRVWSPSDGRLRAVLRDDGPALQSLAIAPAGDVVVTGDEGGWVWAWDLRTRRRVHAERQHEWPVMAVAFSADGRQLASAAYDAHVRLWDPRSFEVVGTIATGTPFQDVAFSPDGERLVTAGTDGVAVVWRADTGQQLVRLVGHGDGLISDAAFLPDGDRVVTSSIDGTTRLWDVGPRGARDWLTVPGVQQIYAGVAFGPDGSVFAAPAHPTGVTLWGTTTGEQVIHLRGTTRKLTTVAFSPDGRLLVAGSDVTTRPPVWDVRSGRLLHRLTGHVGSVRAVAFSPEGDRVVTAGRDATVRAWDAGTGEQVAMVRSSAEGFMLAFAPDGRLVMGEGARITVRDPDSLGVELELTGHDDIVTGLAFEGGSLVSASFDGTARIWDLGTGEERLVFRGHRGPVNQAAVSPDGRTVATSGEDGTARLWDLGTGDEELTLVGHSSLVFGVDFSPDGRMLATASPDGTVALHLLPVDELVDLARERLTRTLTDEECLDHLHGPCP